jgi:hypothetical protein
MPSDIPPANPESVSLKHGPPRELSYLRGNGTQELARFVRVTGRLLGSPLATDLWQVISVASETGHRDGTNDRNKGSNDTIGTAQRAMPQQ